jgi:hypothetical protein
MARLYLTQAEYDELYERQGRKCCVQGCEESENLEAEHSTPEVWRHGKPDQLMCKVHHKIKTRSDIKKIWKAKRLNGEVLSQYERRKRFGSQLRGRGFYRGGR